MCASPSTAPGFFKCKVGVAYRSSSNFTFALRSGLPMAFPPLSLKYRPDPEIPTPEGARLRGPLRPPWRAKRGRGSAKCGGHNLALWTGLQLLALQPETATLFQYFPLSTYHLPFSQFFTLKNEVATVCCMASSDSLKVSTLLRANGRSLNANSK